MTPQSAASFGTRDLALVGLAAGLIVGLGAIPPIVIGILPVPITLQSFGVMLAGLMFGPKRGALACLTVLALVAAGLPVLSGGRGGLAVFAGPTVGYLLAWVPAAYTIGFLAMRAEALQRPLSRAIFYLVATVLGGIVVLNLGGMLWLSAVSHISLTTIAVGSLAFLPGDLIKAVIAVLVVQRVEALLTLPRV
ncbi:MULTISPECIES: biotin transporter BioY [Rhodopseudomonas]|uniref:Biotin transporter n=1 Tax=Rhodopseudomonas palustris TaxID=1076 RepID=A0A0D7EJ31_RHOPL|nr:MULTISPECIES: biotin transporter BioY [Rhodopseudomonas]KIZ39507.1 biotin biosynthesis protein BioC [Rhodopseudomonas palustris]MDF3812447.1 biotin transporter BioY [Rhodopseudomonas sp. BAL398]WOK19446.1 biotin transporter BioY [Rhodopseudomonas sp. BAL398]